MDPKQIVILATSCKDKNFVPEEGSSVCKCAKCGNMAWLSAKGTFFRSMQPLQTVWCNICIDTETQSGNKVVFADLDNLDQEIEMDMEKMLADFERSISTPEMIQKQEQSWAHIRTILPNLLIVAMGKLRIWQKWEDLLVAITIRTLVMEMLARNLDLLGPGELFNGYSTEEKALIVKFLLSTNYACHQFAERLSPEKWQELCRAHDVMDGIKYWFNQKPEWELP